MFLSVACFRGGDIAFVCFVRRGCYRIFSCFQFSRRAYCGGVTNASCCGFSEVVAVTWFCFVRRGCYRIFSFFCVSRGYNGGVTNASFL